jgi:hypothetical protein
MRKRCNRRPITPLPPRGLRPKLAPDQVLDLGLAHVINLDELASGKGNVDTLWQWVGGVLTWSHVAQKLQRGVDEMTAQLELSTRMIERYKRTGRALFTGPDYQLAKVGLVAMDQLAEIVDRPTAIEAAEWSEGRVGELMRGLDG